VHNILQVNSKPAFTICEGYLILSSPRFGIAPTTTVHGRLYRISSFDNLWRPTSAFTLGTHHSLAGIPCLRLDFVDNILRATPYYHDIKISIAESPLHDDAHQLVVRVVDVIPPIGRPSPSVIQRLRARVRHPFTKRLVETPTDHADRVKKTVSRYHLFLPGGDSPWLATTRVVLKSVIRDPGCVNYGARWGISWRWYSGFEVTVHRLNEPGIVATQDILIKEDTDYHPDVQLSSTGVIMFCYRTRAVLYYSV
jgi:hypothetical protein